MAISKWQKWLLGGLGLGVLACAGLLLAALLWHAPGDELTPAGLARNTSHYIEMPDGARIAADVWLPADLQAGQRVPAVIEGTRYWRAVGLTLLGRTAAMLGVDLPGVRPTGYNRFFPAHGYAMVTVDVRGTGASSGVHRTEYAQAERLDYAHIIEWVASQTWASGDVFALGVSYSGTSAELMTTVAHPALRAVAPLYSDFDAQMQLATPGGVYQPAFIEVWSELVAALDRNDLCAAQGAGEPDASCGPAGYLLSGVKPVAGNPELAAAVAEHATPDVASMVQALHFRDSPWGEDGSSANVMPYGLKAEIEAADVPMFVVAGWFDAATADGALARFATFAHPQEVWIGPFSHGGGEDTDPFMPAERPSLWTGVEQVQRVLAFFERHRTDRLTEPLEDSRLRYYVNGADTFRETAVWPPAHLAARRFYLAAEGQLQDELPRGRGFARYEVDFTVGTAASSRWQTQLGGGDVIYDRRADMAPRSLLYTSAPFTTATEATGAVILDLWMTSDRTEGALHAYLETLDPDGQVHYLTEGVLNLRHRKRTRNPAYPVFGPTHSFLAADAAPLPQRQLFSFSTTLSATSALIPAGYRLRLSITGGDAASFARVPADGPAPVWNVYHGVSSPSSLTIFTAPWEAKP
ncbi:MAG: CocE/NonD family hydrolase [Pseudomonadota bacterium]